MPVLPIIVDDVHRELGARRVRRARVLAGEVRRDRRRGQPRVGHEPGADRVAEVDDPGPRAEARHPERSTPRLPRCGSSTIAKAAELDLVDEREPEVRDQQEPDLVLRERRPTGRSSRKPVPERPPPLAKRMSKSKWARYSGAGGMARA